MDKRWLVNENSLYKGKSCRSRSQYRYCKSLNSQDVSIRRSSSVVTKLIRNRVTFYRCKDIILIVIILFTAYIHKHNHVISWPVHDVLNQ